MDRPSPTPLSSEQRAEVRDAGERARRFLKAGRVASFNIWTLASFSALTLLFGFASPTALLLGMGLAGVAWNEHRGRQVLRSLDPDGPRILGRNQLILMAVVVAYALWRLWWARSHPDPSLAQMDDILGSDTSELVAELTTLVYLGVIAVTVLFQGLLARYYLARASMVEEHLRQTPDWVVVLQRDASLE